jgi:hypothetical protein
MYLECAVSETDVEEIRLCPWKSTVWGKNKASAQIHVSAAYVTLQQAMIDPLKPKLV